MPRGGPQPGSGRKPGSKNKATIERELKAQAEAQRLIDHAKANKIELATSVLDRAMKIAEGSAGRHRPITEVELPQMQEAENAAAMNEGRKPRQLVVGGSWPLFGEWFDRWVWCARELAKYQSPQYRAIAVAMTPAPGPPQQERVMDHEPRDTAERERRAANSYLRLVRG